MRTQRASWEGRSAAAMLLALAVSLPACGRDAADAPMSAAGEPLDPALAEQTELQGTRDGVEPCETASDCTYETIGRVESVADCWCPRCPHESGAIARKTLDGRKERYRRVCGEWARANGCVPKFCERPKPLVCTEEARCDLGTL